MLNCGHSYCEHCLALLYKPSTKNLTCPACLETHSINSFEDLSKLIKNYTLISLVEAAKSTPGNSIIKSKTLKLSKSSLNRKQSTFEKDLDDLEE